MWSAPSMMRSVSSGVFKVATNAADTDGSTVVSSDPATARIAPRVIAGVGQWGGGDHRVEPRQAQLDDREAEVENHRPVGLSLVIEIDEPRRDPVGEGA